MIARKQVSHHPPHLLVVCSANQCRSPIAEFLLRRRFRMMDILVTVSSAGTHADDGLPMHPFAQQVLERCDFDPSRFTSRRLCAADLDNADLILVAERTHLESIAGLRPAAARRGFPILQFAQMAPLLAPLPNAEAEEFSQALQDGVSLALSQLSPRPDYDLADPIAKGQRAVNRCARLIDHAAEQLLTAFIPRTTDTGSG